MLFLTRKIGESIIINDEIELVVQEVRGRSVKLGFNYPSTVKVLRKEIYDRIQAENRVAAAQAIAISKSLGDVQYKPAAPKILGTNGELKKTGSDSGNL